MILRQVDTHIFLVERIRRDVMELGNEAVIADFILALKDVELPTMEKWQEDGLLELHKPHILGHIEHQVLLLAVDGKTHSDLRVTCFTTLELQQVGVNFKKFVV